MSASPSSGPSERLLSSDKVGEELAFLKSHASTLSTLKQKYPGTHTPPIERRSKRPTLANIPVVPPPELSTTTDETSSTELINLTLKSLKPPLVFTLAAAPTSTILSLKHQLSAAEPTAPPPESQRWILKGKALGDGKLLKEFEVKDGAVVNLMIKAGSAAATPAATTPAMEVDEPAVPALTISTPTSSTDPTSTSPKPALHIETAFAPSPSTPAHPGAEPELWIEAYELLKKHFGGDEKKAVEGWEGWLGASQAWFTPAQKALIREKVGISAMGGV
ncbi:hypothetical protein MNV49_001310 [Pseudohyphozyma bogoriensis]|nr:hypothetical protein MNV49_001310 [Pseudohyphozyma bogoriensis]